MLDRSKVNFLIDATMFLCILVIAGLGFLMKFVLIPGKERWVKYGRNVELLLLGMDRHQWGAIHLVIGFILLGALSLHIILHWSIIVGLFKKLVKGRRARRIIASSFVIISALAIIVPLTVKPEIQERGRGKGRAGYESLAGMEGALEGCGGCVLGSSHEIHRETNSAVEIRGYMTLGEVSEKYNIPINCLIEHLGIPDRTSGEEKLGRLRKRYDFRMTDVERIIDDYHHKRRSRDLSPVGNPTTATPGP